MSMDVVIEHISRAVQHRILLGFRPFCASAWPGVRGPPELVGEGDRSEPKPLHRATKEVSHGLAALTIFNGRAAEIWIVKSGERESFVVLLFVEGNVVRNGRIG